MQIELHGVTVRFGDRLVLDDLTIAFASGQMTAVIGPSGSGKSTLLGVLARAVEIESGSVEWGSTEPRVEWIFQSTPLLQRRRVIDNAALSAVMRGAPRETALLNAARSLRDVGVLHLARQATHRLSGGEKQRVAVARAMSVDSAILLADEPTASLDARARDAVCDALRAAATSGAVVLVATHDAAVAARADRIVAIENGQLRETAG